MGFVTAFSQEAKLGATAESPLAKTKRERAALAVSNVYRDFSRCPRCGAPTMKARAYNSSESEFWVECTQCNTFINTYIDTTPVVSNTTSVTTTLNDNTLTSDINYTITTNSGTTNVSITYKVMDDKKGTMKERYNDKPTFSFVVRSK